jgi:hypothetical protein
MISINVHPSKTPKGLASDLGTYNTYLGQLTYNCLKHEAALCALAFLKFTPPFRIRENNEKGTAGLGKDDELVGKQAVERDIRAMFRPTDDRLAGAVDPVYGSMESFLNWKRRSISLPGNSVIGAIWADTNLDRAYGKAKNLMANRDRSMMLTSEGQMASAHKAERNLYRGRITRNRGPSQDIKKNPYLVEAPLIKRYVELRQQAVGLLKSAWANVIQSIGKINLNGRMVRPAGGKLNQWITKHGNKGMGALRSDERNKRIKIINGIGDTMGVSSEADTIRSVIRLRSINLASNPYQKEVDKSVRLWNMNRIVFKK